MYSDEKKEKGGVSAQDVVNKVNSNLGSNLQERTIWKYVQEGHVGESPYKRGCPSVIDPIPWKSLWYC